MSDPHRPTSGLPRAAADPLPLKLWMVVAAACTLSVILGVALTGWAQTLWLENLEARIAKSRAAIEALPGPAKHSGPLIVVMGSSLSLEAIGDQDAFASRIAAGARVLVLARGSAPSVWIERMLPVAAEARPDILILQSDLVDPLFERQQLGFFDSVFFVVSILRHGIDYEPGAGAETICANRTRALEEAIRKYAGPALPRKIELSELRSIGLLRQRGIPIVILDIPRSFELEHARPELKRFRVGLADAMKANGFAVWEPPGVWKQDNFCDFAHLNDKGRMRFDPWLAGEIRKRVGFKR